MKKMVLSLIAIVLLSAGSVMNVAAQQKIGYINSQELIMAMPERDSAMGILEEKRQDFLKQSESLQVEFNKKYEAYATEVESLSTLVRQTKEDELSDLKDRIDTFTAAADQELQRLNGEIFKPIVDRAQKAIKEVAAEDGFTYVLDTYNGIVLVFPEEGSENLMPKVLKKLGIQ